MVLTLDRLVPLTFGQWTYMIEEQFFTSQIIDQIPAALTVFVNTDWFKEEIRARIFLVKMCWIFEDFIDLSVFQKWVRILWWTDILTNKTNLPKYNNSEWPAEIFLFSLRAWMLVSKIQILVLQGNSFYVVPDHVPSCTVILLAPLLALAQSSHTSRSGLAFQEPGSRLSAICQNIFCTLFDTCVNGV